MKAITYSLLPLVGKGKVFAVPTKPINVMLIGNENGYNIYVEQPNNDLKFVNGLSQKENGAKLTETIIKEFVDAAATDELVRRADNGDDSVEFYKAKKIPKTIAEARELFLDGADLFLP